jgi:hypothetical protein
MIITNNGNVDINIDGNFVVDFNDTGGVGDVNLVLRVWMGNGTGCGITQAVVGRTGDTNGFGGYGFPDCPIKYAGFGDANGNPVTPTGCKTFRHQTGNDVNGNPSRDARLVTKLLTGDSNMLCFSGDLTGDGAGGGSSINTGNHPLQFQLGDGNTV